MFSASGRHSAFPNGSDVLWDRRYVQTWAMLTSFVLRAHRLFSVQNTEADVFFDIRRVYSSVPGAVKGDLRR